MIEWTCIECDGDFTKLTGDVDERMCEDCLNKEDDLTVYRCGWCGIITDRYGYELKGEEFETSKAIIEKHGDKHTTKINGECCSYLERL